MGPVVASGILAGRTGLTLEDYLSREKVPANFVFLPGFDTRLNIEIVDSTDNSVTQINTTGPSVSEEHVQQLINNILRISHADDLAVLAGMYLWLVRGCVCPNSRRLGEKGLKNSGQRRRTVCKTCFGVQQRCGNSA